MDALLARVRDAHPRLALDGYASGEAEAVLAQAYALWEALSTHGVRYAEEDPGRARGPRPWSQHVRRAGRYGASAAPTAWTAACYWPPPPSASGCARCCCWCRATPCWPVHARRRRRPVFIETTALGARHGTTPAPPPFRARLEGDSDPPPPASFRRRWRRAARYHAAARRFGRHDPTTNGSTWPRHGRMASFHRRPPPPALPRAHPRDVRPPLPRRATRWRRRSARGGTVGRPQTASPAAAAVSVAAPASAPRQRYGLDDLVHVHGEAFVERAPSAACSAPAGRRGAARHAGATAAW